MFPDDGSSSVTSTPFQLLSTMSLPLKSGSNYQWMRTLKAEERGLYLIHLLLTCGNCVSSGNLEGANVALDQISQLASPDGDTMQRIAAYFAEALATRVIKSWSGLQKALNATKVTLVSEEFLARKLFFEYFPFMKMAFVVANQAILEAMEGEKVIHIIDLNAAEPAQWLALLQVLSARPEGPPHLRITGIHNQREVLEQMARKLTEEAEKLDIPFQFNPIVSGIGNLDIDQLRVKTGEALAISSPLQLHQLLATADELPRRESPLGSKGANGVQMPLSLQRSQKPDSEPLEKEVTNGCSRSPDSAASSPLSLPAISKIESFLNSMWALNPKIMVVIEQDSDHNRLTLMERLLESMYSYASLFDCLESTVSRTSLERLKVEKMIFGEEIKNIIACEGLDRKERHEKLKRWSQRLESAGFGNIPLSPYGVYQAGRILEGYKCDGYKLKEENGCLLLCWHDRSVFSVSAWRTRK